MLSVIKSTGEKEDFSEIKLRTSIKRAGIPDSLQNEVVAHVKDKIYENIPTSEIYHHVIEFLQISQPYQCTRYSLKQSLMDLGPTGYPFEDYVARLLIAQHYNTQVRQIVNGKCITHEIDVVATKDNECIMVEAKFHNGLGVKTDVHVALYTKARFDDCQATQNFTQAMLITNTSLTSDAIAYAQCVGMSVIGWNYPEGRGLRELIDTYHLYPITALASLSMPYKQQLLEKNIVLCKEITEDVLFPLGLTEEKKDEVMQEVHFCLS